MSLFAQALKQTTVFLKVKKVREGQTVDALALGGDEGRDKLRKVWGRCK